MIVLCIMYTTCTWIGLQIHGVLNAIGWGILMPIGAIMARYVKVFQAADPAWFYLHVACQCSAYIIGISGWGLGLKLGSESVGITYHKHRDIAIALFCLATVQVINPHINPLVKQLHRRSLCNSRSFGCAGVCIASEAEQGAQVQDLLECVPPLGWILHHNLEYCEHIRRI